MGQVDTIASLSLSLSLSLLLVKSVNVFAANVREARQFASTQLSWDKIKQVNSVPPQRTPKYLHMDIPGIPTEVYMLVKYKLRVSINTTLILFQIVELQVSTLHGSSTDLVQKHYERK